MANKQYKHQRYWIYIYIGFILLGGKVNTESFNDTLHVHQHLQNNIHKDIRPLLNQTETMRVKVNVELLKVENIDAKSQVLSVSLGIGLHWNYETLRWNRSQFGNVSSLTFSPNDVWLPDVAIINAAGNSYELYKSDTMKVTVAYKGWTSWYNGGSFHVNCRINFRNYPFDTQVCPIYIGKIYSSDTTLTLHRLSEKIGLAAFEENDEWQLLNTSVETIESIFNYSKLSYNIRIKRISLYYVLNTILPVIIISFMNTLSFKIPLMSGERISYCVSLFLTFVVLLNSISSSIPQVSRSVSYLQLYVNVQFCLGMVTTTLSILMVNLSYKSEGRRLPKWFEWIEAMQRRCKKCPEQNDVEDDMKKSTTPQIVTGTEEQTNPDSIHNDIGKGNEFVQSEKERNFYQLLRSIDHWLFGILMFMFILSTVICFLGLLM